MAVPPPPKTMTLEEFMTDLPTLLDRLERESAGVLVEYAGTLFSVRPQSKRTARHRTRHFSTEDPLFEVMGIGHSGGPGNVATNKHKYLAEAYGDLHCPQEP